MDRLHVSARDSRRQQTAEPQASIYYYIVCADLNDDDKLIHCSGTQVALFFLPNWTPFCMWMGDSNPIQNTMKFRIMATLLHYEVYASM